MSENLTPQVQTQSLLSFSEALKEVIKGNLITRESWNDVSEYGALINDYLTIHTKGKFNKWILTAGDLEATDWKVI